MSDTLLPNEIALASQAGSGKWWSGSNLADWTMTRQSIYRWYTKKILDLNGCVLAGLVAFLNWCFCHKETLVPRLLTSVVLIRLSRQGGEEDSWWMLEGKIEVSIATKSWDLAQAEVWQLNWSSTRSSLPSCLMISKQVNLFVYQSPDGGRWGNFDKKKRIYIF